MLLNIHSNNRSTLSHQNPNSLSLNQHSTYQLILRGEIVFGIRIPNLSAILAVLVYEHIKNISARDIEVKVMLQLILESRHESNVIIRCRYKYCLVLLVLTKRQELSQAFLRMGLRICTHKFFSAEPG